jgi:hypothetical protein
MAEDLPAREGVWTQRAGWTLVWLAVVRTSFEVGHYWTVAPFATVLALVMAIGGSAALVAVWVVRQPSGRVMQALALTGVLLSVVFPIAFVIHQGNYYPTDSAAFDHVAASVLAHGKNPYAVPLASASNLLYPPAAFWTYTTSGSHVLQMSYPAGSVLAYMPAYLLGLHHLFVSWVDLAAWVVSAALMWVLLPRSVRVVVALLAMTPIFIGQFGLGGTDALWMPWMILAVWRWDRFASVGAGWARWVGPVALGVACSIKQTPWFFVPVFAIGLGIEAWRRGGTWWKVVVTYVGIVAAVFAVVNVPFVVWGAKDWWKAVMLPFFGGLVAEGQGLVGFATHGFTSGVDLTTLSVSALLGYLAILVAFATWYSRLKRAIVLLVPFAFLLAPRSLSDYLVNFVPVALVAAVTVSDPAKGRLSDREARSGAASLPPWLHRRVGVAAFAAAIAAVVATSSVAFASEPLQVVVNRVKPSKTLLYVRSITVTVRNETAAPVEPHFTVNTGPGINGWWRTVHRYGLIVIPPHGSLTVKLLPRLSTLLPEVGRSLIVEVYTPTPNALSLGSSVWNGPAPPKVRPS